MAELVSFRELIVRVCGRDEAAATEIVRRYEPILRRCIQVRLRDLRIRSLIDCEDVCQMVLANFFVRAAWGRFELETPEQLLQLLLVMARHQLANQRRLYRTARRDRRRVERFRSDMDEPVDRAVSPSQLAARQELLREARRLLSPAERELLALREQGWEWTAIAARRGDSPEALRKQLGRAIERVAHELDADKAVEG